MTNREMDLAMKTTYAIVALTIAGLFGPTITAYAEPVYLIAKIQIEDQKDYFESYGQNVGPLLKKTGARVLVASPTHQNLEGEWQANWTVVLEFASEKHAKDFYFSDDYQNRIRPMRLRSTSRNDLILAPAFTGLRPKTDGATKN